MRDKLLIKFVAFSITQIWPRKTNSHECHRQTHFDSQLSLPPPPGRGGLEEHDDPNYWILASANNNCSHLSHDLSRILSTFVRRIKIYGTKDPKIYVLFLGIYSMIQSSHNVSLGLQNYSQVLQKTETQTQNGLECVCIQGGKNNSRERTRLFTLTKLS